jgi:hypothetical protein
MRFEVLTAVEMSVLVFSPEDGGSMFLKNTGICLEVHMALLSRIQTSAFVPVQYILW